jgi:hypothetical protein
MVATGIVLVTVPAFADSKEIPPKFSDFSVSAMSRPLTRRKVMEWFNQKTDVAGIQIPNWGFILGIVIVILLAYSLMH